MSGQVSTRDYGGLGSCASEALGGVVACVCRALGCTPLAQVCDDGFGDGSGSVRCVAEVQ